MNRRFRWTGAVVLLPVALAVLAAVPGGEQGQTVIRGFAPGSVAQERELERRLARIPDARHAENYLRRLTLEPHMAGTQGSRRVAEWLRDRFRSYGFESKIVTYKVWLPLPLELKLELVEPEREELATMEQPFEGDKDTYNKRAVPGFNTYSPSGDVTAPVVYANYGMADDYRQLEELGISVEGKVVLARYGRGYRGIKAKLAEDHRAVGLLIYSDPADDGYSAGDPYPYGPWRPMTSIQRGSILYTEIYPGDPLSPGAATSDARRISPSEAKSLPSIPTLPINAQDASSILKNLGGAQVPRGWQGSLPFTYHLGPGQALVHLKLTMDYRQRTLYDVISRLRGTNDDEWVILGNHHDAWVFGAADPSSGTTVMLETARSLGRLARAGWKPRRTIVMCEWDGEEPGLLGSTEWVKDHLAELQSKAVAYVNADVGVSGPDFKSSAVPSLKGLVREVTQEVSDARSGRSVYDLWKERLDRGQPPRGNADRSQPWASADGGVPLGALGAGSDFCPFLDHAGIPAIDLSSSGNYGVYHSLYDDFYWMKNFGDPTFAYHVEMARIVGTLTLRLAEADVLPFDYTAYSSEISRAVAELEIKAKESHDSGLSNKPDWKALDSASAAVAASAARAAQALEALAAAPPDSALSNELDRALARIEQALLNPEGLVGRPWYKHTIYAPGSYAGYDAVVMPGISEAIERHDAETAQHEVASLTAALVRAGARLDEATRLAKSAASNPRAQ